MELYSFFFKAKTFVSSVLFSKPNKILFMYQWYYHATILYINLSRLTALLKFVLSYTYSVIELC